MHQGLAVILHRHSYVGFRERPRFGDVPESYPVSLARLSVAFHVHGFEEIHRLELVYVAVDRGLGGSEKGRQLLGGPRLRGISHKKIHEKAVGDAVPHPYRIGFGIVSLGKISYLRKKSLRDDVRIGHSGHRSVAGNLHLEQFLT